MVRTNRVLAPIVVPLACGIMAGCASTPPPAAERPNSAAVTAAPATTTAPRNTATSASPTPSGERRYTKAQVYAVIRETQRRTLAAERKAARARMASAIQKAREEGRAAGRVEGEKAAREAFARQARPAPRTTPRAAPKKLTHSVDAFEELLRTTSLFGDDRLKEDKARLIEAGRLLDYVHFRLKQNEYRLVVTYPAYARSTMEDCGKQKVSLSVSSTFNRDFAANLQKLNLEDGLALVAEMYDFRFWMDQATGTVWFGAPDSPPPVESATLLKLIFDERKYL